MEGAKAESKSVTEYEVHGPQLKMDKKFLSFLVKTGKICTESIEVYNNGSTAIYYEWMRVEKDYAIVSSLRDCEERFYCHHVKIYHLKLRIFVLLLNLFHNSKMPFRNILQKKKLNFLCISL